MTTPTFTVRVAFTNNPFDAAPTWNTLTSSHLMSWRRHKGRQYELNRIEAGTTEIVLLNTSGYYWPNNTAGAPYQGNIKPWKRVNLRATYDAVTYDLFTGYVEAWEPGFIKAPITGPVMVLKCSDAIKNLSKLPLDDGVGYAQELSGTRVGNVLDDLGWPAADRTIDTGQSTLQATGALSNVLAMTHLFTVQDTELGMLFISGDGKFVFQDRHARLKSPYTVSQGIFGDNPGAGELPYASIMLSYDDERIANNVRVTRLGGTEQVETDATSITAYGKRNLSRPSLLMTTDAEAEAQAEYLLAKLKDPLMRLRQITVKAGRDPDNLYPLVFGLDVSSRITVKLSAGAIDGDYHIEGITQSWKANRPNELETTWQLDDASREAFWVLGTTGFTELGETTRLAY